MSEGEKTAVREREKVGKKKKKTIREILAPNPVNKEKEKRFFFLSICEPVRGGRAANNLGRELLLVNQDVCACGCASIQVCAQCFSDYVHFKCG